MLTACACAGAAGAQERAGGADQLGGAVPGARGDRRHSQPAHRCARGMSVLFLRHLTHLSLICFFFLPKILGALPNLKRLVLDDNPLRRSAAVPDTVLRDGGDAVYKWLRNSHETGSRECTRLKLMVVGEANVGKTSLLRCFKSADDTQGSASTPSAAGVSSPRSTGSLMDLAALMNAGGGGGGGGGGALSNRATDGIDISEWQLALPAGARHKTVTFSAWDFAGQEVYYSTHQFFLNAYVSAS